MKKIARTSIVLGVMSAWVGCGGGESQPPLDAGATDAVPASGSDGAQAVEVTTALDLATALDVPLSVRDGSAARPQDGAPVATDGSGLDSDPGCPLECADDGSGCWYATGACGFASCAGAVYQAAGVCAGGVCVRPAAETCPYACSVAAGGCTAACTPGDATCATTGIPMVCDATGVWRDQPICSSGAVCARGACQCAGGQTYCGSACVDLTSDDANCGGCGNDCASACVGCYCNHGACEY
jgi:hypothetical protein